MQNCFSKGEYILTPEGEKKYLFQESVSYNDHFYMCKAKDLESGLTCFLKFVKDSDCVYKLNNLTREGGFRFSYPFIEHVYGNFHGIDPQGDPVYGVSVEYVVGQDLKEFREELEKRICEDTASIIREEQEPEENLRQNGLSEADAESLLFRQMMQFLYAMNYYTSYSDQVYLHRDIKPDNIMITPDGNVKIIDFDFAHLSGSEKTMFVSGWDLGFSTGYSSPEVFAEDAVKKYPDLACEIYAAGRVLFYWLNGIPYYSKEQTEVCRDGSSNSGKPGSAPYCMVKGLRYGIEANTDRFKKRYLGWKFRKLRRILDRMCASPESGAQYRAVSEIISDMYDFLLEYCDHDAVKLEQLLRIQEWNLLTERPDTTARQAVMVTYKVDGGVKTGGLLYESTMRDVEIDGIPVMTIYNMDGQIRYIPLDGFEIRRENGEEYDTYIGKGDFCEIGTGDENDHDILLCNGTEIAFTIGRRIAPEAETIPVLSTSVCRKGCAEEVRIGIVVDATLSFTKVYPQIYFMLERLLSGLKREGKSPGDISLKFSVTLIGDEPSAICFRGDAPGAAAYFTDSESEVLAKLAEIHFYGGNKKRGECLNQAILTQLQILNEESAGNRYRKKNMTEPSGRSGDFAESNSRSGDFAGPNRRSGDFAEENLYNVKRGLILLSDAIPDDGVWCQDFTGPLYQESQTALQAPDVKTNHGLDFAYIYTWQDDFMPVFRIAGGVGTENRCVYGSLASLLQENEADANDYVDRILRNMISVIRG